MKRRHFLKNAGLASAAPLAAAPMQAPAPMGDKPAIKITDIKTFLVWSGGRNWVYVKVLTDQGIHGIGEAYSCGPDEATVKVIEDYKLWLVGQDPRNIQFLWDLMYNTTRFPGGSVSGAAMSGIEHALWDIAGKAAGLPCWALLGGRVRQKVRVYQSIGGGSPTEAAENAKQLIETYGYTAVKMSPHNRGDNQMPYNMVTRIAGQRVGAVREAVGPDVDIGVDIHARYFEVQRAIRVAREIEPYYPFWLEEPIRPENFDAMKKLADHVNIPLASGRVQLHQVRVSRSDQHPGARHHSARHLRLRRHVGDEENRRDGRGAVHGGGAAQPHEPSGGGGQRPLCRLHPELPDPRIPGPGSRRLQGRAQRAHHGQGRPC